MLYGNGAVTVVPCDHGVSTIPLHDRSTMAPVLHDTDPMTAAPNGPGPMIIELHDTGSVTVVLHDTGPDSCVSWHMASWLLCFMT